MLIRFFVYEISFSWLCVVWIGMFVCMLRLECKFGVED